MKILDCTLRDGGYYTNWDFDTSLVKTYIESINNLPVDYIEIGYRSKPMTNYYGEFFYLPVYVMKEIRKNCNKKIAIMLNEKDVSVEDVFQLINPALGMIDMVRLAVDPKNFRRALGLAEFIKNMGFEVGFNVMYMSKWLDNKEFFNELSELDGKVEYFNMVDSFGSIYPQQIKEIYEIVRSKTKVKIGFHGHNNIEMGLINTLTAIECGADIVDATISGMGRGAGNLKTELLLTSLNSKGLLNVDFNILSNIVDKFSVLQKKFQWGSNLPYMVSGANSLPQKEVMEWVGKRYYSFNSIIRALTNQSKGIDDNEKFETINFSNEKKYKKALIVGGGESVVNHTFAINYLLNKDPDIVIIHASSKNSFYFNTASNKQFFCLVGNEGYRLEKKLKTLILDQKKFVLPPFPRKMGTYIPNIVSQNTFELPLMDFTDKYHDSHTSLAIQTAKGLGVNEILLVGYDGYSGSFISEIEQDLVFENEYMFSEIIKKGIKVTSITPTKYKRVDYNSIYSLI